MPKKLNHENSHFDVKVIVELSPDDSVLVEQLLEIWEHLLISEPVPDLSENEKANEIELLQSLKRIGHTFSSARFHSLDEHDELHNTSYLRGSMHRESVLSWQLYDVYLRRMLLWRNNGRM